MAADAEIGSEKIMITDKRMISDFLSFFFIDVSSFNDSLIIQNSEICAALRKMENLGSWEKMWQWRWDIVIQEMH